MSPDLTGMVLDIVAMGGQRSDGLFVLSWADSAARAKVRKLSQQCRGLRLWWEVRLDGTITDPIVRSRVVTTQIPGCRDLDPAVPRLRDNLSRIGIQDPVASCEVG